MAFNSRDGEEEASGFSGVWLLVEEESEDPVPFFEAIGAKTKSSAPEGKQITLIHGNRQLTAIDQTGSKNKRYAAQHLVSPTHGS